MGEVGKRGEKLNGITRGRLRGELEGTKGEEKGREGVGSFQTCSSLTIMNDRSLSSPVRPKEPTPC
mgnify:CR=1 FL=1